MPGIETLEPDRTDTSSGFNKLPKHSINDLYFDIEGLDKILNPEENSQSKSGLEYLFGIYNHGNIKEPYTCFWAHNKKEEREQFIALLNFIEKHIVFISQME